MTKLFRPRHGIITTIGPVSIMYLSLSLSLSVPYSWPQLWDINSVSGSDDDRCIIDLIVAIVPRLGRLDVAIAEIVSNPDRMSVLRRLLYDCWIWLNLSRCNLSNFVPLLLFLSDLISRAIFSSSNIYILTVNWNVCSDCLANLTTTTKFSTHAIARDLCHTARAVSVLDLIAHLDLRDLGVLHASVVVTFMVRRRGNNLSLEHCC